MCHMTFFTSEVIVMLWKYIVVNSEGLALVKEWYFSIALPASE